MPESQITDKPVIYGETPDEALLRRTMIRAPEPNKSHITREPQVGSIKAKEQFKLLYRWLARNYDKEAEQALFALEREIDGMENAMMAMSDSLGVMSNE